MTTSSDRKKTPRKGSKKRVLGRGLGNLIPEGRPAEPSRQDHGAREVSVDAIDANPYQPRTVFDQQALEDLAASIRTHGIIQPLVVTPAGDRRYRLIAGERRLRAASLAGLDKVPVVERKEESSERTLAIALIENVQREALNPIEEARAYERLHDEFALTQEEIAERVGKSRSSVANLVRLLKLPVEVQQMVESGELSMGHARALITLEKAKDQIALAKRIVAKGLNVRQAEELAAAPSKPETKKTKKEKDVFTRDAEERLARALMTKVEIARGRKGGTIKIAFGSEDELIRLFERLSDKRRK